MQYILIKASTKIKKIPHAKELHQEKGEAIKNSHSEKEINDIYK